MSQNSQALEILFGLSYVKKRTSSHIFFTSQSNVFLVIMLLLMSSTEKSNTVNYAKKIR